MGSFRTQLWRSVVCLLGALLLLLVPTVQAASTTTIPRLEKLFPQNRGYNAEDARGITFRAGNCLCIAMGDTSSLAHYIFVQPTEKGKAAQRAMDRVKATAEQLADYIKENNGYASVIPFADGESGYVINLLNTSSSSSYSYSSSNSIVDTATTRAIGYILRHGGTFYKCADGEVVMLFNAHASPNDAATAAFSLFKDSTDVVAYVPSRSVRRSEERIISALGNDLRITDFSSSSSYYMESSRLKNIRNSTGAAKCLAASYNKALVVHRNRYLVGEVDDIRNYIRNKKKSGYLTSFDYPKEENPIPGSEDYTSDDSDDTSSPITIAELFTMFRQTTSLYTQNHGALNPEGCRIFMAQNARDRSSRSLRYIYVRSHTGSTSDSSRYATCLRDILELPRQDTSIKGLGNGVVLLTIRTGKDEVDNPDQYPTKIADSNFPDIPAHWPDHTRSGKPLTFQIPGVATTSNKSKANEQQPSPATPKAELPPAPVVDPAEALQGYLDYLRKLKR